MTPLARLLLFLLVFVPGRGLAHGGLPLSTQVMWRGQTIYVPAQYWGLFVREGDGPWRWICDEAINNYKLRDVVLGGDGTFYATDLTGLSLSRDGGCTWEPAADLSQKDLLAVAPDPTRPTWVWVAALDNGQAHLLRSEDAGRTFRALTLLPGQAQRGLAVAAAGRVVLTGLSEGAEPQPLLHISSDDGMHFTQRLITPRPPFLRVVPLGIDGRDAEVLYAVAIGDPTQALLRVRLSTGAASELLRIERPIYQVAVDKGRDRLYVASGEGLYHADGPNGLTRSAGLSRAQCVAVREGALYACSWNYYPDNAALARSEDGGGAFTKVFQFADTRGLLACPASSTVGRVCPDAWRYNCALLGIEEGCTPPRSDMGPDMPAEGCSCAMGRSDPARPQGLLLLLLVILCIGRTSPVMLGRRLWR